MTNIEFCQKALQLKKLKEDFDFCTDFIQPYMLHQHCNTMANFSCNRCHLQLINWLQEEHQENTKQPDYLINGLFLIPSGTPVKVWNENSELAVQASFVQYGEYGTGVYAIADKIPEKWRYCSLLKPSEINWSSKHIPQGLPILVRNHKESV